MSKKKFYVVEDESPHLRSDQISIIKHKKRNMENKLRSNLDRTVANNSGVEGILNARTAINQVSEKED
jgi:hypothetical protein